MTSSPHRAPKLRLVPTDPGIAQPSAPPALDDSELLLALRAGDATAATALHDRVRPQVDRTVRRLLGPGDIDREDVAQLAMIELVTTIDRYRADCSLDTWTSTIAARVVYKHIRRRKTEDVYKRQTSACFCSASAEDGYTGSTWSTTTGGVTSAGAAPSAHEGETRPTPIPRPNTSPKASGNGNELLW